MDAISTEALTKHYAVGFWRPRPYVALDALTLQVGQGEVFGFLGPNGAGKTTTLKLLMQLIYPTSGHAEILGKPVGDVDVKRRVGIAQALINDPEIVFLDEPMSGLDPLGRREIRQLILRLRDRGCTVFFSSHVLSDAEALCSRVAILAKGRLMTAGRLNEMLAFRARGWELVASAVTQPLLGGLS